MRYTLTNDFSLIKTTSGLMDTSITSALGYTPLDSAELVAATPEQIDALFD